VADNVIQRAEAKLAHLEGQYDPSGVIRKAEQRLRDLTPVGPADPLYNQYLEIAEAANTDQTKARKLARNYNLTEDVRANDIYDRPGPLLANHQRHLASQGKEITAGETLDQDITAGHVIPLGDLYNTAEEYRVVKSSIDQLQSGINVGNGQPLSDSAKRSLTKTIDNYMTSQARESRGRTVGGSVLSGLTKLPAFMLEFWATGPGAKVAKETMSKVANAGIKKVLSSKLRDSLLKSATAQTVGKGLLWTGEGLARTMMIPDQTIAGTLEKQMPESVQFTDKGELIVKDATEKPFTSFMRSFGDEVIEMMSETSGPGIRAAAKGVAKLPLVRTFVDKVIGPMGKAWTAATGKTLAQYQNKILKAGGFDGVLEEMGEERVGNTLRAVLGIEDFGAEDPENMFSRLVASIPSGKDLLIEAGIMAPLGIGHGIGGRVGKAKRERHAERSAKVFRAAEAIVNNGEAATILGLAGSPSRKDIQKTSGKDQKLNSVDRQKVKDVLVQFDGFVKAETEAEAQAQVQAEQEALQAEQESPPEDLQAPIEGEIAPELTSQEPQEGAEAIPEGEEVILPTQEVQEAPGAIEEGVAVEEVEPDGADEGDKPKPMYRGYNKDEGELGKGGLIFFSENETEARKYAAARSDDAKGQVIEANVTPKNTLDLTSEEGRAILGTVEVLDTDGNEMQVKHARRSIKEAVEDDLYWWQNTKNEPAIGHWKSVLMPKLQEMGYDSVSFTEDSGNKTLALFDPSGVEVVSKFEGGAPVEKKLTKKESKDVKEEAKVPGPRSADKQEAKQGEPEEAGAVEEEVEVKRTGPTGSESIIGGFEDRAKDVTDILADTFTKANPLPKGFKFSVRKDGLIELTNGKGFSIKIDIVDNVVTKGMDEAALKESADAAGIEGEYSARARYYPNEGLIEIDEKYLFDNDVLYEELFHAGMHQLRLKKPELYREILDEHGGPNKSEDVVFYNHFLNLPEVPLNKLDSALDKIRDGKAFHRKISSKSRDELEKLSGKSLAEYAKSLGVKSIGSKAKSAAIDKILGDERLPIDSKDWRANFDAVMKDGSPGQKIEMMDSLRKEISTLEDALDDMPNAKIATNKLYREWLKGARGILVEVREKAGGKVNFAGHHVSTDMKKQFHSEKSAVSVENLSEKVYDTLNGKTLDQWASENGMNGVDVVIEAYENGVNLRQLKADLRDSARDHLQEEYEGGINGRLNELSKLVSKLEGTQDIIPFSAGKKRSFADTQKVHDEVIAKLETEVKKLQDDFAEKKKNGTFTKGYTTAAGDIQRILKSAADYAKANLPKSEHHKIIREMTTLKVVSKWKTKTDPLRRVRAFLQSVDKAMTVYERSEAHKELKETVKKAQKQFKIFSDTPKMFPEHVKAMAELLKSVDFAPSKDAEGLEKGFEEYLEADPEFAEVVPEDVKDAWKKLTRSSLRNLETEDLEEITKGLKAIMANQKNYAEFIHGGRVRKRAEVQQELLSTIGEGTAPGETKLRSLWKKFTTDQMENIESFVLMLDGGKPNGPWQRFIYDEGADAGTTDFIRTKDEIESEFNAALDKHGVKMGDHINRWSAELPGKTDIVKIKTDVGTVTMTPSTRIAFSLTVRQKDGIKALLGKDGKKPRKWYVKHFQGGMTKGKTVEQEQKPLTKQAIQDIVESMPAQEKAYAEALYELHNRILKKIGNEASVDLRGYKIFSVKDYYRLYRHKDKVKTTVQEDLTKQIAGGRNVLEGAKEFTERDKNASAPLVIMDSFPTLNRHVNLIAALKAHGRRMRNVRSMLKDPEINEAVTAKFGDGTMRTLETLVNRVAGQSVNAGSNSIKKLRSNIAGNILVWNPGVWLAQPLSLPMAALEMEEKHLLAALADRSAEGKKIVEEMATMKYSPQLAARRQHGHIGRDVGDYINAHEMQAIATGTVPWQEKLGVPMQRADNMATSVIMLGAYKQAEAENPGKSKDTVMKEAVKIAERTVRRTQPTWDTKDRTLMGGSESEALKTVFMFRSFRDKVLKAMLSEFRIYQGSEKTVDDKARLGKVLTYTVITTAVLNHLRKKVISAARGYDSDDDDSLAWTYIKEIASLVPGLDDALRLIEAGFNNKGFFEKPAFDNVIADSVTKLALGIGEVGGAIFGKQSKKKSNRKKKNKLWSATKKIASGLRMAPAPIGLTRGIITELEGVARHFEPKKRKKK